MTDENAQILEGLGKDFLHTYVELTFRGTHNGIVLKSSDGGEVKVLTTTTHKFGPGFAEIHKNGKVLSTFKTMRGCIVKGEQFLFMHALRNILELKIDWELGKSFPTSI